MEWCNTSLHFFFSTIDQPINPLFHPSVPGVSLARHAMATRFEMVLYGNNPVALRAAGEEALDEIDRLEERLSQFKSASEIAHLNARACHEPVRVSPAVFALLQHAQRLHAETDGAFDITIEPLMRCWGFRDGLGRRPTSAELAEARARVGMALVRLNPKEQTVEFAHEGVRLDLGAIGKGCAIERAAELLREAGVTSALLHGGTSTVHAIGQPPDGPGWKVAIGMPDRAGAQPTSNPTSPGRIIVAPFGVEKRAGPAVLATVSLKDESLSVSEISGRYFQVEGGTFGHVIDPRTGQPVTGNLLAAVVLPSATETDALSTALLILGTAGHDRIAALRPSMKTLLVTEDCGQIQVQTHGISVG